MEYKGNIKILIDSFWKLSENERFLLMLNGAFTVVIKCYFYKIYKKRKILEYIYNF